MGLISNTRNVVWHKAWIQAWRVCELGTTLKQIELVSLASLGVGEQSNSKKGTGQYCDTSLSPLRLDVLHDWKGTSCCSSSSLLYPVWMEYVMEQHERNNPSTPTPSTPLSPLGGHCWLNILSSLTWLIYLVPSSDHADRRYDIMMCRGTLRAWVPAMDINHESLIRFYGLSRVKCKACWREDRGRDGEGESHGSDSHRCSGISPRDVLEGAPVQMSFWRLSCVTGDAGARCDKSVVPWVTYQMAGAAFTQWLGDYGKDLALIWVKANSSKSK